MAPALALQAVVGLLLTFLGVDSLLTNYKATGVHFVSSVSGRGSKDNVATGLVTGSAIFWLDPMGTEDGALWEVIVSFHLTDLGFFFWLEEQGDKLHHHWEGPLLH